MAKINIDKRKIIKVGIISERLNRPLTGVGSYTYSLIKELSKISSSEEGKRLKIYLINYKNNELFPDLNKIIINNPFENILEKSYYLWHAYLPFRLRNEKFEFDLLHIPDNSPLFLKLKYQKKIITVHDLIPRFYPETVDYITLLRFRYLFPRTLKTADKIIAVSNNTKKDLIKYFNVPAKKIKVIPLAPDEKFRPLNHVEINEVKQKYNLNFPFILYVGNLAKHKNIPMLIKAFYRVKKRGIKHKLIIAGMKRWEDKEICETIDKLNLQNEVVFTGYFPEEDLCALYNAADLFVYPSLYEGFGLPPLEAMACGCPVITSNTSSLPEVVGEAGIMINPYDVDMFVEAMKKVLTDTNLRKEMIERGLKQAKKFSWRKTAEETLKVYEDV